MTINIDVERLAHDIAEIARTTRDPKTGGLLLRLLEKLLTAEGLPHVIALDSC